MIANDAAFRLRCIPFHASWAADVVISNHAAHPLRCIPFHAIGARTPEASAIRIFPLQIADRALVRAKDARRIHAAAARAHNARRARLANSAWAAPKIEAACALSIARLARLAWMLAKRAGVWRA